jgi:hypothetical protein
MLLRPGVRVRARAACVGVLVGALAVCACGGAAAQAAQSAKLQVSLSPERLGAGTTIAFGFEVEATGGGLPAALTELDVRLPPGMGIDTSGLQRCSVAALAHGPSGCSRSAQVGSGSVKVQVPLGEVTRLENAVLTVFNGPREDGRGTVLFYAAGRLPIATQLIFAGVIVPGPQGQSIEARIPLIPTLPNAPDAALVAMSSTLGTLQHAYYRTVGHKRERFAPKGATIPARCPAGGLPFAAELHFNDATSTTATTTVPCPR